MIEDRNFSLVLDGGWRPMPSSDPALYAFADQSRGASLLLSAVSHDALPGDLDRLAWRLVDRAIEKETSAAQAIGQAATIFEPIVMPQPWGRAIAFHGHDGGGRRFGFAAMMTCRCRIALRLSSDALSESALLALMDEISSQIAFDRTPLETAHLP